MIKKILVVIMLLMEISLANAQQPTLYLIGDSTMSDKENPEENPEHGWGQVLPDLMTKDIGIENYALNGRSSKSFIAEGHWKKVVEKIKSGDFLFIQFGHNDQKQQSPDRYTNPYTGYRYNLQRFVKEAREKGATPVLLTSIVRRNFNDEGVLIDTHGAYPLVVRMVADDMGVPLIDLQWLSEQLETKYGPEDSSSLHLHYEPGEAAYYPEGKSDNTHLSKKGATLIASLALQEIAKKDLDLKQYIKKEILKEQILP